ncbi:SARP family transcriptional regulator [Lentzea sp. NBRC 105346]|uniref:AfsR/SARP family transcriptional regulator n=1 Tax=Lentzea sp. NBRC 105346 TaxID=3032205 RepID=UPI0024A5786F|nr:BTAD domain-containing putative transcriptional regulator [Lentzea sp. NBRC 105346]GLZ35628.1 SARP family transcriptional regulator [Lentzea sp. NBRC 105346]
MAVRFGILGDLLVRDDRGQIVLPAGKLRVVLATLLINNGAGVSADELADRMGGTTAALQTAVMRLRQKLGPHRNVIRTLPNGYVIELEPDQLDLTWFDALVAQAAAADDPAVRSRLLTEALGLWRGRPLRDVPSPALHRDVVPGLLERRLAAVERRVEADLRLGRHAELIGELRNLVAEHPLRERLTGQLMVALHRSNRAAEAEQAFQAIRERLADELGLDPGPDLQALQDELRRPRTVPAQLPADVAGFVGRAAEIARLDGLNGVAAISGPPGAGKTALAVHVAHRLRDRFPGGQLHVNLRGYSPQPPMQPAAAITRFLRSLGVAPEDIPVGEPEQVALYRRLLAERRVLLLLDNAASADQVRPLLPDGNGCAVLLTSRDTLHDLDALPVSVGQFSRTEALGLLGQFVDAGHERAAELADACAHLPLAIRIAGARITNGDIAGYLDELHADSRLAALAVDGDEENAVQAAFSLSYLALPPDVRRLFRLLGHAPGVDFTAAAASVLAGAEAGPALERLTTANLLQHADGRFTFHDLLREFAMQRCAEEDPDRDVAARRLAEWYLASADHAVDLINTAMHRTKWPEPLGPGRTFTDTADARAWLSAELGNLVATVTARPASSISWRLADALRGFLMPARHRREWAEVAHAGLEAAVAAGDDLAMAVMYNSLGALAWSESRLRDALGHFTGAKAQFARLGPSEGLAAVLHNAGIAHMRLGEADSGIAYLTESLEVCRAVGGRLREANTLSSLGMACVDTGRLAEAEQHLLAGLVVSRELGNEQTEATCLGNLCHAHRAQGKLESAREFIDAAAHIHERITSSSRGEYVVLDERSAIEAAHGRLDEALALGERGRALAKSRDDRGFEARFLNRVGVARNRLGDPKAAVALHTEALVVFTEAGELPAVIESLLCRAEAHHALGDDRSALRDADEAAAMIERTGLRLYAAEVHALQAKGREWFPSS